MSAILSWISSQGLPSVLLGFTIASILLSAVASVFSALGDALPGWLGTASSAVSGIIHFLNGNLPAAATAITANSVRK